MMTPPALLEKTVRRVALGVALLVALAIPAILFVLEHHDVSESLEFKARVKASALSSMIASNPETWMFAENRLQGLIAREPVPLEDEQVRLFDKQDALITEVGSLPSGPSMSRSYPLYDAGQEVGLLVVSGSLGHVVKGVLISAMLGFVLGAVVYFGMKWLPLRALRAATEAQQRAETSLQASLQNVAEREAAELGLKQLNEELERRVAQRTAEMQAALETAERANAAKGVFLANMSHEIRTPISAVMGLARIGMRQNVGRKTEITCSQILDAGKHLLGVVNDILDFSRIEAGKLVIDPRSFHLADTVQQAVDIVADRARAKDLRLMVEYIAVPPAPTFVIGDALRLGQILMNLLSNAIKFTEFGEVRLSIDCHGDHVLFRVADSGPGMTSEQMSRLFKPFEQADNTLTRKFGGSGLGLAISRDLAILMGGDIAVSSAVGQGSVFTLHLPLPAGEPVEDAAATLNTAEGPLLIGLCILAAEDVEVNRVILEDLITTQGATVVWAHDGQQAVDLVASRGGGAFDVVLMDIQMPVMDGYDATLRIRVLAPQLPVIGLTAHAMAEERERCLAAGMVAHLTKPIDPDVVVATILEHVTTRPPLPLLSSAMPETVVIAAPAAGAAGVRGAALIDQGKLRARYQYRQIFIDKLLATIASSHADSPAKLRAAVAAGDTEAIRFVAHALKGIGGSIEAAALAEQARITEDCVKAGSGEASQQALKLAEVTEAVLALIKPSAVAVA